MRGGRFVVLMLLLPLVLSPASGWGRQGERELAAIRGAVRRGDPDAAFRLALMYLDGKGVPRRATEAVRYMRMAAERGHVRAQYYLGTFYHEGKGVKRDRKAAARWIGRGAAGGDPEAQYAYGMLLLSGDGVAVDKVEAMEWLGRASRQGNEEARDVLRELVAFQGRAPESLPIDLGIAPDPTPSRIDGKNPVVPRFEGKGVVLDRGEFSVRFSMPDWRDAEVANTPPDAGLLDRLRGYRGGKFEIIYRPGRN